MFYPCLYMFAMWDAYKSSFVNPPKHIYLPFAFSAYFVTIGLMYSPIIYVHNKLIGPVFLPILSLIPGIFIGNVIRRMLLKRDKH